MRAPVSIAGSKVKAGQQATIHVPVARLYTHTQMTMPVRVVHGQKDGPRLFVSAAIHGDEINGIDLHAGSNHRTNLPQIRANIDDPDTMRLAEAFRVPVVIKANARDGSLRQALAVEGIPYLLYEAGEVLRFDEVAIRAGVRGILSVMEAIGMLRRGRTAKQAIEPLIADATTWVRAPASGILHMDVPLGHKVGKNKRIGVIADPFGDRETPIESPVSGMVIGRLNLPLVHRGDAVIHVAQIDRLAGIEPIIADFNEEVFADS